MKNEQYSLSATFKHPEIESLLSKLTGVSRVGAVAEASCATCGGEASVFRDDVSRKAFK